MSVAHATNWTRSPRVEAVCLVAHSDQARDGRFAGASEHVRAGQDLLVAASRVAFVERSRAIEEAGEQFRNEISDRTARDCLLVTARSSAAVAPSASSIRTPFTLW
jgi:hypothetical protein